MKVIVVDDSVVFRMAITEALKADSSIEVASTASNGQIAVDYLRTHQNIDLMILDMEMPVMDGLTTITKVREFNKNIKIIVFSSLTQNGAELTLKALDLGANDFVTKQEASSAISLEESSKMIESALVPKINAFKKVINKSQGETSTSVGKDLEVNFKPELILIASSTGGPDALSQLFESLDFQCPVPILLVQHMPPIFTTKLADMLNKKTKFLNVKEAQDNDVIKPGNCYIAPGDYHMVVDPYGKLRLNQDEKVSYVRPSATVMFDSVVKNVKSKILTIVLTGMGDDGAASIKSLLQKDSDLVIQDEQSSIVWGMPGAVKNVVPNVKQGNIAQISKMLNNAFKL